MFSCVLLWFNVIYCYLLLCLCSVYAELAPVYDVVVPPMQLVITRAPSTELRWCAIVVGGHQASGRLLPACRRRRRSSTTPVWPKHSLAETKKIWGNFQFLIRIITNCQMFCLFVYLKNFHFHSPDVNRVILVFNDSNQTCFLFVLFD